MQHSRVLNLLAISDQPLQGIADDIGYASIDELVGKLQTLVNEGLIQVHGELYSLTEAGEQYLDDRFLGRSNDYD